jgi:hypothetical protein
VLDPVALPRPRRGRRYAKIADLDPATRPHQPPLTLDQTLRYPRALRPRRSRHKSAPDGGYYYWCLICNHCLLDRSAFCPRDAALYERRRKARERELARPDMKVHKAQVQDLRDLASRVDDARRNLLDASRNGSEDADAQLRYYIEISKRLARAARRLPTPPD